MGRISNWVNYQLGFSRIAHVTLDPPNHLYEQNADGSWTRPLGATKTEVVLKFNWRGRLRLLLSGKVHVVMVIWYRMPTTALGDSIRFEVMPPFDKVDPKLKV